MPTPPVTTTVVPPVSDDNLDDFGYEKMPAPVVTPPVAVVPPPAEVVPPVEEPATGYGKKDDVVPPPTEVVPPVVEKKPEDMTDEEKAAKEITDVVKSLGDEFDQAKISKFVLDNKLTKEQVAAYVKDAKDSSVKAKNEAAVKLKEQRDSWKNELMSDKEFGGLNSADFDHNVHQVENLLKNNMPNLKKHLTEKGGVLPPYIMRDLLSLSKALNPKAAFVQGEAATPPEDSNNFLDDMYK